MASSSNAKHAEEESSNSDDSIDPLSPHFDPMKALYAKSVKLPVPGAKQFNNLAEFENYMKGKDAKTLNKDRPVKPKIPGIIAKRAAEQAKESVRKAALMAKSQGPSTLTQTQLRRQHNTTVFSRMELFEKGPMSLLRRCVQERLRVIVVTRAAVTVKSRCRGYVIAFDKHMNMAMMDVDEKFLRPILIEKEKKSKKIKEEEETKSVESLSSVAASLSVGQDSKSDEQRKDQRTTPCVSDSGMKLVDTSKTSDTDKIDCKPVDLREKLSSKTKIKDEAKATDLRLPNLQGTKEKRKSTVKQETSVKMGPSEPFWTAYKSWAEQRSYTSYEVVERHVNQFFIRGDNVVSVILDQGS